MNWTKLKEPIGRMQYFKRILPIAVVYAIFTNGHWVPAEYHWLVVLIVLTCLVLRCVFAAQRMRDMNWNPWLSLLACVPIVGLVIGLCCLIVRSKHIESSTLELSLGRKGADNLIRDLKTAKKAGDAGDKELEQTLARKALLDGALSAAQEAFRTGSITLAQRDTISDNMRSNPNTSTLMDELCDALRLKEEEQIATITEETRRPGLQELISAGRIEEYVAAKHRALEIGGDFDGMAKAEALHHIGNAMKDFSARVLNAPNVVLGNLAEGTPEFLNIDEYVKALQALQDDTSCWDDGCSNFVHAMHGWSRLEQVFGKDGAKKALQDAYNAQKNSASTITIETAGYPEYGIQPMVVTMKIAPRVSRLGDLLVKEKVITSEQLEQATKFQKDTHTRLESALVKLGFLSDEDVTNFLSRQYGVPAINLSHLEIDPAVVKLIPYETAKWLQILPLSRVGASLTIAMVNPTNVFAMDAIKFETGFNIEPVVASESSIIEGIGKAYGTSKDGTQR